jgi:DnaJ family protein A protein 5
VKEFNDTVRQLVGFVKKRDKRFVKRQLEKALLEKETAALAERRKAEAKQEKHKKAAAFEEADWTKQDADGPQWLRDEVDAADRAKREKADQRLELFCPVCRKLFKSQKQWENHEQSKQHKQSVLRLKEEMMADEELVRVAMDEMESGSGSGGSGGDSDEGDEDDLREGETRDGTEKADVSVDDGSDDDDNEDASDDDNDKGDDEGDDEKDDENDEDAMLARMMGHARVSKKVPVANVTDGGVSSSDDDDARSVASSAFCDRAARNKPRKMLKKNKVGRKGGVRHTEAASEFDVQRTRIEEDITEVGNDAENDENDANARSNKKTSLGFDVLDAEVRDDGVGLLEVIDDTSDTGLPKNGDDDDDDDDGEPQNLPAKKKSRRAKKGKGAGCKTDEIGTAGELLNCALCRLVFTSGNALHKHLKEAHSGTHKKKR